MNNYTWNEETKSWRDERGARICTFDNETIKEVAKNCVEFIEKRDTIYVSDVAALLEKALEGVRDKKDITPAEELAIRNIRNMIKGL